MNPGEFSQKLADRASAANLVLPLELVESLRGYYELLVFWNRKINLTAMNLAQLPSEAVDRLFIEPVGAARYAQPDCRVIDIGSGGGSPAIPFALAAKATLLTMVESRTRKSVFLQEAARIVGLQAQVNTARYEDLLRRPELQRAFGIVTVRAVRVDESSLSQLLGFLSPRGSLFLFQNASPPSFPAGFKAERHQVTDRSALQVLRLRE